MYLLDHNDRLICCFATRHKTRYVDFMRIRQICPVLFEGIGGKKTAEMLYFLGKDEGGITMAWISAAFHSKTLKMPVEAEILVPQPGDKTMSQIGDYKVIVLLHGANNDRAEWLLKSQIYDLVKELPVVVFMPSGKNSFYVNTANGYDYMDYITKEIPEFIKKHFNVSEDRRDWLIAGESMGGYGAAVCGLNHTEQFGNIGIMSGALNILEVMKQAKDDVSVFNVELLFGNDLEAVAQSSLNVMKYCHEVPYGERPRIFLCCGKQDFLYAMNKGFYHEMKDEYDVTYTEGDGNHDFLYWNERLKEMIPWFMEDDRKKEVGA